MKNKFLYIFLLFSASLTYGQVTLMVSEIKDPKVNQRFNLTVMLEIAGENMLQETPLRMPDLSKFDIIGYGSEQNTIVLDARRGDIINQMVFQWVLSPKQAGKIKFGSVLVTVNGKIYKTEPFDINVRESDRSAVADNQAVNDLYLNMEIQDKSVYPNEPTIAVLRAYSRDYGNFRKLGKIQLPKQKNVHIAPVSLANDEIETNAGIASKVLAVFMIFPSESGHIEINPVSATVANAAEPEKIKSNRVRLHVKKLPEGKPKHYKNAVGEFAVEVINKTPNEITEIDKPLNISLRLSGSGNLNTLSLPKILSSDSYTFFPPKITANTVVEQEGLKGTIIADYVVIPKKPGAVTISFEDFAFFSPEEKKFMEVGPQQLLLDVKTHEQIVDAKSALERVNEYTNTVLETVNTPVLKTHALKVKEKDKINWYIVIANLSLLAGVLGLFSFVKRRISSHRVQPVAEQKPITTIAETEDLIRKKFHVPFSATAEYLKKLAENEDFSKFFEVYEELHNDTKSFLQTETESKFKEYIAQNFGQQTLDNYRELAEQLKFEKYAPYHTREQFMEMAERISLLYSEIRNNQ